MDIVAVVEDRPRRVLLQRQLAAGEDEVQRRHIDRIVLQLHQVLRRFRGEGGEDLLLLLLLLDHQLPQRVVQAHDRLRLDEERGARGGLVVDDARHLALVLRLDGQAVPVAAHGDDVVLQVGRQRDIDHLLELLVDLVAGEADLPAHFAQSRARVIGDLLLGDDAAADLALQRAQRIEAVEHVEERILFDDLLVGLTLPAGDPAAAVGRGPVGLHTVHVVQERGQVEQFGRGKRSSDRQGSEHIGEIAVAAEADGTFAQQHGKCSFRLDLRVLDLGETAHGEQLPAQFPARLGAGQLCQTVDDLVVFDDAEYFFIHKESVSAVE